MFLDGSKQSPTISFDGQSFHETLTHTAPGHAMDESEKEVLPTKRDVYVGLVVFVILAVTAWLLFVELGDTLLVNQWWMN